MYIYQALICVQIRMLIPLLLLPCLPECLHYAGSWEQGGFKWACKLYRCFGACKQDGICRRVPKCLESAEMQEGDIYTPAHIYIYI